MTSPHNVPVAQSAPPQLPAPRPPFDPWASPQPQPAWGAPGTVPHGNGGQPAPVPVGPPSTPEATLAAPGYAAAPHGQVPRATLPGYAHAPVPSAPPGAAPHGEAAGWTSWDTGQQAGTNGLAIAAFVVSWVFWPAALVMGSVALLSKRRRNQPGRGWAVAAVVLSLIWAVATVVVTAAVFKFLDSGHFAALSGASRGTAPDLRAVAVGKCFLEQGDKSVLVDCTSPHHGEVFFTGSVVGTGTIRYPGELLLEAEAEEMCHAAFAAYVGLSYEQSQWHYRTWVPTEDSWADGDRAATCAIIPSSSGTMTGSVAASAT